MGGILWVLQQRIKSSSATVAALRRLPYDRWHDHTTDDGHEMGRKSRGASCHRAGDCRGATKRRAGGSRARTGQPRAERPL